MSKYPWYEIVKNDELLLQGDFIDACPIIVPPDKIEENGVEVDVVNYNVIVMSQSCDLAQEKIDLVLVCPYFPLNEMEKLNDFFKSKKGKETLRRGNLPGYHLLNKSKLKEFQTEYLIVDFHNVFSVHFDYLKGLARKRNNRLRLLSPYKEHLSQAFARFFMRVGLPVDIPPFK